MFPFARQIESTKTTEATQWRHRRRVACQAGDGELTHTCVTPTNVLDLTCDCLHYWNSLKRWKCSLCSSNANCLNNIPESNSIIIWKRFKLLPLYVRIAAYRPSRAHRMINEVICNMPLLGKLSHPCQFRRTLTLIRCMHSVIMKSWKDTHLVLLSYCYVTLLNSVIH